MHHGGRDPYKGIAYVSVDSTRITEVPVDLVYRSYVMILFEQTTGAIAPTSPKVGQKYDAYRETPLYYRAINS